MNAKAETVSNGQTGYQQVQRRTEVSTEGEPMSLINAREVDNWCLRCKGYKDPFFSDETWAGVFVGIAAGLAAAWWASDLKDHPDKAFALKFGVALCLVVALAFVVRAISQRRGTTNDLSKLATEMDGACKAGLPKAKSALERRAESTTDKGAAGPAPQSAG
jgi:hypothetical protein